MKCEEYVADHCMLAIKYEKYAEVRDCKKCCLYCKTKCENICDVVKTGGR